MFVSTVQGCAQGTVKWNISRMGHLPIDRGVLSQVWLSEDSGWWCVTRAEHSITAYNSCSSSPSVCVSVSACAQWGGAAGMTLPSSSCALHGARFSDTWLPIGRYCKGSAEGKQIRGRLIPGCDMSEAKHVTPLIKLYKYSMTETSRKHMPSFWEETAQQRP